MFKSIRYVGEKILESNYNLAYSTNASYLKLCLIPKNEYIGNIKTIRYVGEKREMSIRSQTTISYNHWH